MSTAQLPQVTRWATCAHPFVDVLRLERWGEDMEKVIKSESCGTFRGTPDDYAVEECVLKGHVEELARKHHIAALLLQQKQLEEDLAKLDIADNLNIVAASLAIPATARGHIAHPVPASTAARPVLSLKHHRQDYFF